VAYPGDLLLRTDAGNIKLYQNTNTLASPTWTEKAGSGASLETDVANMAAAGTGTANVLGASSNAAPVNHVHALGDHDHSGATKGNAIALAALGAGFFTANAAGRGKFAAGLFDVTTFQSVVAAGILSADATGRAFMATGFFSAAKVLAAFAANAFDAAACEAVIADSAIPSDKVNWSFSVTTPVAVTPDSAGSVGTAGTPARSDHDHPCTCAAPSGYTLAAADAEGAATSFARSNHVHKAILANNVYFVGRNQADGADLNLWKANTSDLLEIGVGLELGTNYIRQGTNPASAGILRVPNNTVVIKARNAANSGDISMWKINASDILEAPTGIELATFYIKQGTNPASAGILRVPNNTYAVSARNAANAADVDMIKVNASDYIEFGASVAAFTLAGNITGGANALTFSTGYVQFNTGSNPASAGALRFANNTVIGAARNAANAADINLWKVNAEDDYEAAADVNLGGNSLIGGTAANADLTLVATSSATKTTAYIVASQMLDCTTNSLAVRIKAGAIGDGECAQTDLNGEVGIDSTNGRWYFRYGAAWHYCAIDAGFQVNADEKNCPVCGKEIKTGQAVAGRIDKIMSDGAPHGLWCHLSCLAS
jgi:hypothetical protein